MAASSPAGSCTLGALAEKGPEMRGRRAGATWAGDDWGGWAPQGVRAWAEVIMAEHGAASGAGACEGGGQRHVGAVAAPPSGSPEARPELAGWSTAVGHSAGTGREHSGRKSRHEDEEEAEEAGGGRGSTQRAAEVAAMPCAGGCQRGARSRRRRAASAPISPGQFSSQPPRDVRSRGTAVDDCSDTDDGEGYRGSGSDEPLLTRILRRGDGGGAPAEAGARACAQAAAGSPAEDIIRPKRLFCINIMT